MAHQQSQRNIQNLSRTSNYLKIISLEKHIHILSLNPHSAGKLRLSQPTLLQQRSPLFLKIDSFHEAKTMHYKITFIARTARI